MYSLPPSIYLATVIALGIGTQWVAWRLKLPALVLLLSVGFGFGYFAGPPRNYVSEDFLFPAVSLAVGLILFEGGLSLRFREIRETRRVVIRLVTIGLFITWGLTALAANVLLDFSGPMSVLLGALLTVSGPTVIVPLLRYVRPAKRIGSVIKWEGIVNDPIGAVLAALVLQVVAEHLPGSPLSESAKSLAITLVVGLSLGAISAFAIVQLFKRFLVPDFLQNPVVLATVVAVFAAANYLGHEAGLIAVTVLGVLLANQTSVPVRHVVEFKENIRTLLLGVLFIVLASRIQVGADELQSIGWGGIAFVVALILIIRPVSVFFATLGSDLSRNERLLLAWVHPRGVVAAAVASLFAIELNKTSLADESTKLVLITFLVVVVTVTVYGLTLTPFARRLGLSRVNPQGVLFVGGSAVVREIAKAVREEGFAAYLVDTNPDNIAAARINGLAVCYGSIGSEIVHDELDLGEIGRLLAMTPNDEVNALATSEFVEHFGSKDVYRLAARKSDGERHQRVPSHLRGRLLFAPGVTYQQLEDRFEQGARIKRTTLTAEFTLADFRKQYGESALILFAIPEKGKLRVVPAEGAPTPKAGEKLIALVDKVADGVSV